MSIVAVRPLNIFNALAPRNAKGEPSDRAQAVAVSLDFTAAGSSPFEFDLVTQMMEMDIQFVQFVYIDNADNANPLTLLSLNIEQRITVKGRTQGWYPLMSDDNPKFRVTTTVAAANIVPMFFANVMFPAFQWATQ